MKKKFVRFLEKDNEWNKYSMQNQAQNEIY